MTNLEKLQSLDIDEMIHFITRHTFGCEFVNLDWLKEEYIGQLE